MRQPWINKVFFFFFFNSFREFLHILENFRPAFSPYPTDSPWVSEDVP